MIMTNRHVLPWVLLAALCAVGCGSSPATRFYVLDAVTPQSADALDVDVGIGPVQLAPYLDRSPLITRSGPNTISVAEFDRWAEPLQDGFARALTQDVGAALGTVRAHVFPWSSPVDVRVPVEVLRFDSDEAGTATLVARWSVLRADHSILMPVRRSEFTAAAGDETYAGAAGALSEAIGKLGSAIATDVRAHRDSSAVPGAR
jgi:uncharacterized lipoprotein YmbA